VIKVTRVPGRKIAVISSYEDKDKCKTIFGGSWNKNKRQWEYPETAIIDIVDTFGLENVKFMDDTGELLRSLVVRHNVLNMLKTGKMNPTPHEFLMKHQRICRDIARHFDRFLLACDTGTGKTLLSLQIITDKKKKTLVLCPKAIIKTAWVEDQRNFFPDMKLLPLSRNMSKEDYELLMDAWGIKYTWKMAKADMKRKLMDVAEVFITNPESFKADIKEISKLGIKGLVVDESAMLKNPTSAITKAVTEFADEMEFVYLLSGKPAPNNDMEYFSQIRIIDPAILGDNFFRFKNKYFEPTDYMGYNWEPKIGAKEEIAERIARCSIFISKEECLDLPEKTYLKRMVELDTKVKKYYREMELAKVLELEDKTISASTKVASLMKLRQITSGFVMDTAEQTSELLHTQKLNELLNVLEEIGDKPVIIWAQFQAEIQLIEKALQEKGKTVVTAYGLTKDVDASIKAFKEGKAQYIIAHPKTLKYGVTFVNCTYAVYYSLSYSYEEYYQSHDRIYRKGQTKPCTFIFILCEDTIDEVVYKAIQQKGDDASILEDMIMRAGRGEI